MKKLLCLLTALLLCLSSASALELTDEEFERWFEQMDHLASTIGVRKITTPGEKEALAYLRSEFESYGYSYEDGTLWDHSIVPYDDVVYEAVSLIAIRPALNENPQIVTVCAHYDSIYEGARDNASGVAAMLFLAKTFAQQPPLPDTEMRFIAFTCEESGGQSSMDYCQRLAPDEIARSLCTFNVDIITANVWETTLAFSCDTLGMRTENSYVTGSDEAPAWNRTAKAMMAAMEETGDFPMDDLEWTWCQPRHYGMSDHMSFHEVGIDAANICFRGTTESGGRWPEFMHTPTDEMGDFDLDRSYTALNALYTAVDGVARDHSYGD